MAKRTVLVVDDDNLLRETLVFALAKKGYRVLQASGGESVAMADREQPSMILLDLNMPGMDGADVSAHLRSEARTAHIPIVAMSADLEQARCADMIAQDWLRKPFSLAALYVKLARWA